MQLYIKNTSNCEGLPLQNFQELSPTWTGEGMTIPFGPEMRRLEVVGWTDLFGGRPCPVHVARVRWMPHQRPDISGGPTEPQEGILVWGGNSGVRVLDDEAEVVEGVDDHLPPGWGRPMLWIKAEADLPFAVRDVLARHLCEDCGVELPLSMSPYDVGEGRRGLWLCEKCADVAE